MGRRVLVASLIAVLASCHEAGAAHFPSDSAVRAVLQARVDAERVPGIVVGLIEDGRTRVFAAGRASAAGTARPLDGRTVFEIGSATKVFTTALLADMARRREVSLDQPLAELLPGVRLPERDGKKITLLDLATHRSGLPRMPGNFAPADSTDPYADYTVGRMTAFLAGYALPRAIGERYEYSNLGMGLLGHALSVRAKKDYGTLLGERVLAPLKLNDTRISLTADMQSRLATGHDMVGRPVTNWRFAVIAPAGALRSTADDLLAFLAANIDSNATAISASLRETHRVRNTTGVDGRIGLGWLVFQRPVGDLVWHNGGTGGYHSFIAFDARRRIGVVVLANSANTIDDIGLHLLDPTIPLTPVAKHTQVAIDPRLLGDYAGKYAFSPAFAITVTREADQLFVQATGQPRFEVYPESDSRFFLRVTEAQVSFERDSTGKVTTLILHQNGRDQRAPRVP